VAQLYFDEYARHLVGKRVCIACREGILRDNLDEIITDVKLLSRYRVNTSLFHNLPNRAANRRLVADLASRLVTTEIIRVPADLDFYEAVLSSPQIEFKLIFLERKSLTDHRGNKINSMTTTRMRESLGDFGEFVANVNLRSAINQICARIESGHCERVHILPAGKNTIKLELFSVEGSGTMIANNFAERFRLVETDEDVAIVNRILSMYRRSGYLKPRSKGYVKEYRQNFYVTEIDDIIVGCVEKKPVDQRTVELGALAISTRFRNQRVGAYTVGAFIEEMRHQGYDRFISLTRNPRLAELFAQLGFTAGDREEYAQRQSLSPGVPLFFLSV
jgi:N-acetylglutamate synthase-like GNAT family acetyltransferase